VSVGEIIIIAVVVLTLLAVGGAIAQRRRLEASGDRFAAHLDDANSDLAAAHAHDRGWEPATLEAAARAVIAEQPDAAPVHALTLVQVVDPPGKQEDRAIFRARLSDQRELLLTMARRDDVWYAVAIEG